MNLQRPYVRHLVKFVALVAFASTMPVRRAGAEVSSGAVNAVSIATVAFGATNVISGGVDCVCKASSAGTCTPMLPWAGCSMMTMSVLTLLSGLSQMAKNADSASHFDPDTIDPLTNVTTGGGTAGAGANGGLTAGGFDNASTGGGTAGTTAGIDLPIGDGPKLPPLDFGEFCTKTPDFCNDCGKGGDYSKCKPEMILPKGVDRATFTSPELARALAAFDKAADFVNSGGSSLAGDGSDGGGGDAESGFAGTGGGGGAGDDIYIKKSKGGLGNMDEAGLDNASMWGMDMVDEKSGAKLTLFQRATRRYYGVPDRKRLNFLARAEYVRARAILHAKSGLKSPVPAKVAGSGASASAGATPSRLPASDKSAPLVPIAPAKY